MFNGSNYQCDVSTILPTMDVGHLLFDRILSVNTEISRLVYEFTCMSGELWRLQCENYELKQKLGNGYSYVQHVPEECMQSHESAPNGVQNQLQNCTATDDPSDNSLTQANRKRNLNKCNNSVVLDKAAMSVSLRSVKRRLRVQLLYRVADRKKRSKNKPKSYAKQSRKRYLDSSSSASIWTWLSWYGNRTLSLNYKHRRRNSKKLQKDVIDEGDDDDDDDNSLSGSDSSQDGRLLDL